MDEKLYRQLVAVIRRHSFHIVVGDADGYHEFTNMGSGSGGTVLVRCLTLVAAYAYGIYPRGHTWYIPLSDLHRAIHERAESETVRTGPVRCRASRLRRHARSHTLEYVLIHCLKRLRLFSA